jgi:hypothetical protein
VFAAAAAAAAAVGWCQQQALWVTPTPGGCRPACRAHTAGGALPVIAPQGGCATAPSAAGATDGSDGAAGWAGPPSAISSSSLQRQLGPWWGPRGANTGAAGHDAAAAILAAQAAPPSPFTPAFWCGARLGLQTLLRNRCAAPPGGFACRSSEGVAAARLRCLAQRGWQGVVLAQGEAEAALGGLKTQARLRVGEHYDYGGLEALLRRRLGL